MASGNPTLDAANESTGVEPLNAPPKEPQAPNQANTRSAVPPTLSSLPSGCDFIDFRFDIIGSQPVDGLPTARQFEDIVKAKVHPSGPARAEEIGLDGWEEVAGVRYAEALGKVGEAVEDGAVNVYKVETGIGKTEYYLLGLGLDGDRLVGVRISDL